MATTTTNLGLIEPAGQDRALVANINTNSEKIDAEAGKARANFALVQNGDTATQAISQGQLVVWKGALKKATANIANGATLSSSNLTDDSIATEIASLNGNIANKENKWISAGACNFTTPVSIPSTARDIRIEVFLDTYRGGVQEFNIPGSFNVTAYMLTYLINWCGVFNFTITPTSVSVTRGSTISGTWSDVWSNMIYFNVSYK